MDWTWSWSFGTDVEGRLVVPASPSGRTGQLRFSASAAFLTFGDGQTELEWDSYLSAPVAIRARVDGWSLAPSGAGEAPETAGLSVALHGASRVTSSDQQRPSQPWWVRLMSLPPDPDAAIVIPLSLTYSAGFSGSPRYHALTTLCRVLHDRAAFRTRLDDPDRMARLVADLNASQLSAPVRKTGVRRSTTDILMAMRLNSLDHRYGRPLPGDPVTDEDEAVAIVASALAVNPHAKDHQPDVDHIRSIVRRGYIDIDPWPFGALTLP